MPPIDPSDYAPGSTLYHQGQEVRVRDTLTLGGGGRYLIVSPEDSPFAAIVPEANVRDNENDDWDLEAQESTPDTNPATGDTGDTDGSVGPGDSTPTEPNGAPTVDQPTDQTTNGGQ